MRRAAQTPLWLLFFVFIMMNVAVWSSVRGVQARWLNTPPVPGRYGISSFSLGDKQLAYRATGLMLQNLGNIGGRDHAFKDYDYGRLKDWMKLSFKLDPRSDFVPFLASYYFSATQDPAQIRELVEYLEVAGNQPEGQKWRWLGQAVYLARYVLKDTALAYRLAQELAALPDPTLPAWCRQMPAFIMNDTGDKQAAYEILVELLKSSADKLPAAEVRFTRHYICTQVLDAEAAAANPLCQNINW